MDTNLIITLRSGKKQPAIRELVRAATRIVPRLNEEEALRAVSEREAVVSSWVAPGIAIPHGTVPRLERPVLVLGRSRGGVQFGAGDGMPVHLLVLLLGSGKDPDEHIAVLSQAARVLQSAETRRRIVRARTREQVRDIVLSRLSAAGERARRSGASLARSMLNHAASLARELGVGTLLVHLDGAADLSVLPELGDGLRAVLVVPRGAKSAGEADERSVVMEVPFGGLTRQNHISLTTLLALSRGLITRESRVISVFGPPGTGRLDTLVVVDVARETSVLLSPYRTGLLGDLRPEVLERVLEIAAELSREGREGHPVGALFVLGDYEAVRASTHQMIINPFRGYRDEEKSVLDPSLAETIKEFSTIDGAFLIRGDGVVEAAGAYVRSPRGQSLPRSGGGARHTAAASITGHTAATAIALSQSTGRVTLYRGGRTVFQLDRPSG